MYFCRSTLCSLALSSIVVSPRIHSFEVAEHDLRAGHVPVRDDGGEPLCLLTPLENRCAEMDVVDVQNPAVSHAATRCMQRSSHDLYDRSC